MEDDNTQVWQLRVRGRRVEPGEGLKPRGGVHGGGGVDRGGRGDGGGGEHAGWRDGGMEGNAHALAL